MNVYVSESYLKLNAMAYDEDAEEVSVCGASFSIYVLVHRRSVPHQPSPHPHLTLSWNPYTCLQDDYCGSDEDFDMDSDSDDDVCVC